MCRSRLTQRLDSFISKRSSRYPSSTRSTETRIQLLLRLRVASMSSCPFWLCLPSFGRCAVSQLIYRVSLPGRWVLCGSRLVQRSWHSSLWCANFSRDKTYTSAPSRDMCFLDRRINRSRLHRRKLRMLWLGLN